MPCMSVLESEKWFCYEENVSGTRALTDVTHQCFCDRALSLISHTWHLSASRMSVLGSEKWFCYEENVSGTRALTDVTHQCFCDRALSLMSRTSAFATELYDWYHVTEKWFCYEENVSGTSISHWYHVHDVFLYVHMSHGTPMHESRHTRLWRHEPALQK